MVYCLGKTCADDAIGKEIIRIVYIFNGIADPVADLIGSCLILTGLVAVNLISHGGTFQMIGKIRSSVRIFRQGTLHTVDPNIQTAQIQFHRIFHAGIGHDILIKPGKGTALKTHGP